MPANKGKNEADIVQNIISRCLALFLRELIKRFYAKMHIPARLADSTYTNTNTIPIELTHIPNAEQTPNYTLSQSTSEHQRGSYNRRSTHSYSNRSERRHRSNHTNNGVTRTRAQPLHYSPLVPSPNIPLTQRNTECPITGEEMSDPVYIEGDTSGTRYERSAITEWLSRSNTNPMTRQPCSSSSLRSDTQLQNYISQQSSNPEATQTTHDSSVSNPNIPLTQRNTECPITGEKMSDPVYIEGDTSGTRYERSAISQWLSRSNTNPITRQPCSSTSLRSDTQLQNYISQQSSNPEATQTTNDQQQSTTPNPTPENNQSAGEDYANSRAQNSHLRQLSNESKTASDQATQSEYTANQLTQSANDAAKTASNEQQIANEKQARYQDALNANHDNQVSSEKLNYLKKDAESSSKHAERSIQRAKALDNAAADSRAKASADRDAANQATNDYATAKVQHDTNSQQDISTTEGGSSTTNSDTNTVTSEQSVELSSISDTSKFSTSSRESSSESSGADTSTSSDAGASTSASTSASSDSGSSASSDSGGSASSTSSASSDSGGSASSTSSAPTPCSTSPSPG